MTAPARPPVADWSTDFDHTHPDYAAAAPEIWDDLRQRCPVAHTDRFGGAWLPTRHEDVSAIAHDTEHFSNIGAVMFDWKPMMEPGLGYAPPITSDPPHHQPARKLLLPAFSPKAIKSLESKTRAICVELLDEMLAKVDAGETDVVDAAVEYSQHIPVRIIAEMLGLPESDGDTFRRFIHRILETPGQQPPPDPEDRLDTYLNRIIAAHRAEPKDDLVTFLIDSEYEGAPMTDDHIRGTIALLLIAGIDTTWSAIGSSIWHLAQHPEDRHRLRTEDDLLPFAIEEFLRFYAPVSMARLVVEDTEIGGCPVKEQDYILLSFPAANRDPDAFERADEFVIDRAKNRHAAFGLGIHRCVGSNLARMELTVAVDEFVRRVPDFELADPDQVRWSTGQVRGPRTLPLRLTPA